MRIARGARLVAGGSGRRSIGSPTFYQATVLDDVDEGMLVAREETFGPVVPVTTIRDDGRGAGHRQRLAVRPADRDLHARPRPRPPLRRSPREPDGSTSTRAPTTGRSHLPFGGRAGSQSGVGRVGGRFSMERFTELKTVILNLG